MLQAAACNTDTTPTQPCRSEMVSGFNIVYGGGRGYTDFGAEYASILLTKLFFCVIFYYCVFSKQNGHVKP